MHHSTPSPAKKTQKRPSSIDTVLQSWACEQLLLLVEHSQKKLSCPLTWNSACYYLAGKDIGRRTIRKAVDALAAAGTVELAVNFDGSLVISLAKGGAR